MPMALPRPLRTICSGCWGRTLRLRPSRWAVHESFFPWDDRIRPLRAAPLEWLGQFAESAAWDDEAPADPQAWLRTAGLPADRGELPLPAETAGE